jgi:copper chaperone CopZ
MSSTGSGSFATATLSIGGMSCGHCAAAVEKALKAIPGVHAAQVNLEARQAVIEYVAGEVVPGMLKDAVTKAGYTFEGADLG